MEENHLLLEGCKGVQRTPPLNWYFLPKCHFLQFYSSVFLKLAFIIPTEKEAEAQDHGFIFDLHHSFRRQKSLEKASQQ